jgi:flagellar assembly protein FliH
LFSNKIYKNNQVNIGIPFQIKSPITYQPPAQRIRLATVDIEEEDIDEEDKVDYKAIGEEIVNNAKSEAEMIVKEALLEAKDIFSKAASEVEELKNQTVEVARQEGYNAGLSQAEQEYKSLIEEAKDIKKQAEAEYKQVLDSLEEDAVNTILDIARKVISQELECKENILLLVKDAFDKCSKDQKVILKLSESDYNFVNERADELILVLERSEDVEIKKDLSLKEGGCIIETPYGSIDASANTKFEKIESDFKNLLNESLS